MSTAPSNRSRIRRIPELAVYDRQILNQIIDASYLCHIAFHDESGTHCIPMACWRMDDHLYIHGSNGGRLMQHLSRGTQVCITLAHVDGLVLARSAFNHSMNYRSAVIYGQFSVVADLESKTVALDAFMDKLVAGRKDEVRGGSTQEFGATIVLKIALDEAAAKVRTGDAIDDDKDMAIAAWAGVLPFQTIRSEPIRNDDCTVVAPDYVLAWGNAPRAK